MLDGADFHRRIDEAGRADHLLGEDAARALHLPGPWRRRDIDRLRPHRVPFLEFERAVVDAGGQAEAIFGQRRLAAIVAAIHAADLRHGDVAFVDEDERFVGQIFEQGRRRLAGLAARQPARIVLDAGAGARRLDHLQIEQRALLQPLRFQQLAVVRDTSRAAGAIPRGCPSSPAPASAAASRNANWHRPSPIRAAADFLPVSGSNSDDRIHFVAEQLDAPGAVFVMRREQIDRVAAHAERAAR